MGYTFKVGDTARESGLEGPCHMGGYYLRGTDGETLLDWGTHQGYRE